VSDESKNGVLLEASHVTKTFGGLVAVNDVSFTVPRAGIVSIIGPNGAGKTTFFNMLTGLYKPTIGHVSFEGRNITGKPPHVITKAGIARTFQNIKLFRTMTALENVQVGMQPRLKSGVVASIVHWPTQQREERASEDKARELLSFVGLKRYYELSSNLPYGDQRRLEIARALASEPKLLLLDEPTAGMNPQESANFNDFVYRVRDEKGISVLLIEHDMSVIMKISERITVLDRGSMIAEGTPDDIRNNQTVIEAYLGKTGTREGRRRK